MLIRNKSSTVVAVIPCLGKVAPPLQREEIGRDTRGRREGYSYSSLQRIVAVIRIRWHCNAAGGFVQGLPTEPLDTSRRNKAQKRQGKGSAGRTRCKMQKKKHNVAESERERRDEHRKKDKRK